MTKPKGAQASEPTLPVRLLALDIDGTLVGEDQVIGPRTLSAVAGALALGVHVSLVTGRMASSALPFAQQLGLSGPIVAYQGALVREMPVAGHRLGRLVYHRPLDAAMAREAIAWAAANGFEAHVNHLERFILPAEDPRAEDYSAWIGARAELVPDLMAWVRHPVTKVIAVGPPGRPAAWLDRARATFGRRAAVTVSHPEFIEFVAPGVSKGRAVRWLARRLGVPIGQVLAIGDQYNDLEMIEAAGYGVAMPSAPAAVRAVARRIAPPVAEEGAAAIIEALVLPGPGAVGSLDGFAPGGRADAPGSGGAGERRRPRPAVVAS